MAETEGETDEGFVFRVDDGDKGGAEGSEVCAQLWVYRVSLCSS